MDRAPPSDVSAFREAFRCAVDRKVAMTRLKFIFTGERRLPINPKGGVNQPSDHTSRANFRSMKHTVFLAIVPFLF
jgi:hypothetical protein